MASFGDHLLFFFFLLVLLFSARPIQARESRFFSKFTHLDAQNKFESESKVPSPTLAPAPAPEPVNKESGPSHYGPFGPGSGLVVPTKSTTTSGPNTTPIYSTDEDEPSNEELYSATPETGYQSSNYKNNGYNNNYYSNGYETAKRQGMSDTRFFEGGKYYYDVKNENNNHANFNEYESGKLSTQNQANGYSGSHNYNGQSLASSTYGTGSQNKENGYTSNYNNKVSGNERQGMSDTRFLGGGKYYYDVKNENYYHPANGYGSGKFNTQDQGYYGNTERPNEMDEYGN